MVLSECAEDSILVWYVEVFLESNRSRASNFGGVGVSLTGARQLAQASSGNGRNCWLLGEFGPS